MTVKSNLLRTVRVTELKRIYTPSGRVKHAAKRSDPGITEFGEVYFSEIKPDEIKAWKLHRRVTLNLVVPIGDVRFVFFDELNCEFREEIIGDSNYSRLTIPFGIWFGFQGLGKSVSLIMSLANEEHNPAELSRRPVAGISFNWED